MRQCVIRCVITFDHILLFARSQIKLKQENPDEIIANIGWKRNIMNTNVRFHWRNVLRLYLCVCVGGTCVIVLVLSLLLILPHANHVQHTLLFAFAFHFHGFQIMCRHTVKYKQMVIIWLIKWICNVCCLCLGQCLPVHLAIFVFRSKSELKLLRKLLPVCVCTYARVHKLNIFVISALISGFVLFCLCACARARSGYIFFGIMTTTAYHVAYTNFILSDRVIFIFLSICGVYITNVSTNLSLSPFFRAFFCVIILESSRSRVVMNFFWNDCISFFLLLLPTTFRCY